MSWCHVWRGFLPALWPPAGSGGVGRNGRLIFGGVVGLVGLAPALQWPPRLIVHRERSGALLCHELLVQIVVWLVAAGPALQGPSIGAVHGEEVEIPELLPEAKWPGGRLRPGGRCCCWHHLHLAMIRTESEWVAKCSELYWELEAAQKADSNFVHFWWLEDEALKQTVSYVHCKDEMEIGMGEEEWSYRLDFIGRTQPERWK